MPFIGELSALAVTIVWAGTSFAFTRIAQKFGAIQLNIDRMLLSMVFILITSLIFNLSFSLSYNQILYLTLSGIFGLVIGDSFYFKAFPVMGPRLSNLVMASSPAFSVVLSFLFLHEIIDLKGILGILVTLIGIVLVITQRKQEHSEGFKITRDGLINAGIGSLCQAIGLVLAKLAFKEGDINPMIGTFYRLFTATIILLPIAIYIKRYSNPISLFKGDKKSQINIILGSFFGPFLGISLSFFAIQNTQVGIAAILMAMQPILMLPLSKIIYKEKLSLISIFGALIAVLGVVIIFIKF
jgi:drug/metabolite transporter (DMT)-like permease